MRHIIYLLFICFMIASCGSQKKMTATSQQLTEIKEQQEKEVTKLGAVAGTAEGKLGEGKIDSNIKDRIAGVLKKYQDQIDSAKKDAAAIELLLADKKEFRKNYKSFVLPYLDSLQKNNAQYAERLSLYLMVEDGLNIANYQLFDLAAFFGPGKYIIPDDKTDLAFLSFAPIIDSLLIFSNKYNERPRKASLVILGFADGTGFANEGPLFDTLTSMIGTKEVSKEGLNQKLSELRAKELINQLTKAFMQKAPSFINIEKLKFEYIGQGRGEEFPLPTIKDYLVDDARRRIVLCYWVVLPN